MCEKTGTNGEYTISGLAPGEYIVAFGSPFSNDYDNKPGLAEANPVAVAVGKTTSGIDAALQPKPPERPEDKDPPAVVVIPPAENGPGASGEDPRRAPRPLLWEPVSLASGGCGPVFQNPPHLRVAARRHADRGCDRTQIRGAGARRGPHSRMQVTVTNSQELRPDPDTQLAVPDPEATRTSLG